MRGIFITGTDTGVGKTVVAAAIAVTTHPAAGALFTDQYASDVLYKINIDRNGDAVEDLAFVARFSEPNGGAQRYTITRYTGVNARTLKRGVRRGGGMTGAVNRLKGNGMVFAGLRSDPFFFDLAAFRDDVLGTDLGRDFCDQAGGAGHDGSALAVLQRHCRTLATTAPGPLFSALQHTNVCGLIRFLSGGALPVGMLCGGYALESLGVHGTVLLVAGATVVLTLGFTAALGLRPGPPRPAPPRTRSRTAREEPPRSPPTPPGPPRPERQAPPSASGAPGRRSGLYAPGRG